MEKVSSPPPPSSLGLAEALFLSFVSRLPYQVAALTWRFRVWFFLLLLVVLVQFPNLLRTMGEVDRDLERVVERVASEAPGLSVKAGRLVMQEPLVRKDFIIGLSTVGTSTRVIIDPTIESPVFPSGEGLTVVATATDLSVRFPDGQVHSSKLSIVGDIEVTREVLSEFGSGIRKVGWVVLPVVLLTVGLFVQFVKVWLLAIAGWSVFPHRRGTLPLGASFRVAAIASAPSAILEGTLAAVGVQSFGWLLASLLLSVSYYMYGVRVFIPPPEPSDDDEV